MKPYEDMTQATEDQEYHSHYWNFGYNQVLDWIFESNADWLDFDEENQNIFGTPDNGDIGIYWVRLNITDGLGHYDEHLFDIEVINTPPSISPIDDIETMEDDSFELDCGCDDEAFGNTEYDISPSNIPWLEFDSITGILHGTPTGEDVGVYEINISVDDGNGGLNWTEFSLTVLDRNDPPIIQTEPINEIDQGDQYYVQFNAFDEDDINTYEWTMNTNAQFLQLNNQTGILSGTPENDDVGVHFVNISAEDLRGEKDWINFTLEVIDVNDPPIWNIKPQDDQVDQGDEYSFTAVAIDIDVGDSVSYSISSQPISDIDIDSSTGEITWVATTNGLTPNPNYVLNVEVSATDGLETITQGFTITVIPNPSPTSTILGPDDGKRITSAGTLLEWEGTDDGEEQLRYDIYLGDSNTHVSMLETSVLWKEDVEETSIHTGEVEPGKTYYWTVIPKDVFSSGICTNDVFSFSVNIPPTIQDFTVPEAKVGVEFRLTLMGSDLNSDDLVFTIVEGPTGMEIFDGMITWTPSESQVGTHTVNVSLSDGYETIYEEFEVTVAEKEIIDEPDDKESPIVLIIIIIIVILILAGAGVGLFLYMKKKGEEEPTEEIPSEDTGPPEEENQAYEQLYGPN